MYRLGLGWDQTSTSFRSLAAVALLPACIVDVVALNTLPVLRTWHEASHRPRLLTLFAALPPIKVGKTTFAAEPIVGFSGVLLTPLPRARPGGTPLALTLLLTREGCGRYLHANALEVGKLGLYQSRNSLEQVR